MARQNGANAIVDVVSRQLKKIKDTPNYEDTISYNAINDRLNAHEWLDESGKVNLDTDEKVKLFQQTIFHSGTVANKGNLWYHDQPWMQRKGTLLSKPIKKGKHSHVKAKQGFPKTKDPSEIGFNDDKLYAGTQAKQAEDRAWSLSEGTTGYKEVKAELKRLDPDGSKGYNTTDMFLEIKRFNNRTVKDRLALIKELNDDLKNYEGVTDKNQFYSSGHGAAREKGGPATASNFGFPETRAENFKTQNRQDLQTEILDEIGVDTSWGVFVQRYLSDVHQAGLIQQTDAQRFLTDRDKLDILSRKVDWKTALQARIDDLNNAY